jgi:pSer/pThr/pTyr-binding forkhead associated (FHA) protein
MSERCPVLVGIDGFVRGEEIPLQYGKTIIIGRSRGCDVSLRRCPRWRELESEEKDKQTDFKTVSRKHLRVTFYNANGIELEDLSSNGTFVDGKRIARILISDIKERDHDVLLGTRERFKLEWKTPKYTRS